MKGAFSFAAIALSLAAGVSQVRAEEEAQCPNLTGDWECTVDFVKDLRWKRDLSWPAEPGSEGAKAYTTQGWVISEKDRTDQSVTYVFGVGEFQRSYTAKVQEFGLTPDQDASKGLVAYCDQEGALKLIALSQAKTKLKGVVVGSNPVLSRQEFYVRGERMKVVHYMLGEGYGSTQLSRSVCKKKASSPTAP